MLFALHRVSFTCSLERLLCLGKAGWAGRWAAGRPCG